jgi:hypothetical protein
MTRTTAVRSALFVLVSATALLVPSAAAYSQAAPHPAAMSPGSAGFQPQSILWLRQVIHEAATHRSHVRPDITIGDFGQCPKLPKGFDPSMMSCFLVHITGGLLQIGNSSQIINREITFSYAEGTGPSGDTALIFGSLKAKPMPVLGGIFLTPQAEPAVRHHPDLQLGVQPVGLGFKLDPTGNTAGFLSQKIMAVNVAFGASCAIGTKRHPVVMDPTFGTTNPPPPNQPISGHVDSVQGIGHETVIIGTVVDNAFAAPTAHSCGPGGSLSHLVNVVGGLPSPAGTNTAILQVTVELVGYPFV